MTGKRWKAFKIISMVLVLTAFVCAVVGESAGSFSMWLKLLLTAIVSAVYLVLFISASKNLHSFVSEMKSQLDLTERDSLYKFPAPAVIIDTDGTIVWYNKAFGEEIYTDDAYGVPITRIIDIDLSKTQNNMNTTVEYMSGQYKVSAVTTEKHDANSEEVVTDLTLLYFEDISDYVRLEHEYEQSRMWVMLIMIDSYEDLFTNVRDSDKSHIIMKIDKLMEGFMEESSGIIRKISSDRFLAVIEEEPLQKLIDDQFKSILDKARAITVTDKNYVTISIGVGHGGNTLAESENMAKQALDMTQGRGGDQAAVKNDNDFLFFGGTSKGIEKHTKVKTRIFTSNLMQLVEQSDSVIVMGHKFSDLDALGAAAGMVGALRMLGVKAYICVDELRTLAMPIITRLKDNIADSEDLFISPKNALAVLTEKTLLIIVDTNNIDLLESIELYEAAKSVVYIDHHRQVVNSIDNAVVALHEPYASSASEIVAEVVQYMSLPDTLSSYYADAMLAGIMLDTKDFVNKTGVRTFEAAAFLKKSGADTVAVKKLFANSLESCRKRSILVENASIHKRCAVSSWDSNDPEVRVFSAQAADELLNVEGVDASFVLYPAMIGGNNCINISARSYGTLNVQLIMEKLGGGGHQTMAAAQIYDISLKEAEEKLFEAIDEYIAGVS
ncbi:MAG: DHH family phosphoesterase [Oscillospiraceae bacterium]|nr:DHH family phosphoesterase [Oscillospiraceae bacterium]